MAIISTRRQALQGTMLAVAVSPARADEKEVGAVEDLMREHGVLRRALLIYRESVPKLRADPARLDAAAIHRAAQLFRDFGEEYHEKKLEEAYIFPRVKKKAGPAATMVDTLLAQHRRGREITDFVLNATKDGRISGANAEPLARLFENMGRMYQNHAAREDTVLFPAWKEAVSARELDELGDKFEDIEKQQFGGDGFDKAVREIGAIEQRLGLADLAQFTAPPVPA